MTDTEKLWSSAILEHNKDEYFEAHELFEDIWLELDDRNEKDIVQSVKNIVGEKGADYVIECAGIKEALNDAIMMTNRGGKICLAAFPHEPVEVNIPYMVINNIYMFGIRGEGKSATHRAMQFMKENGFNANLVHTHTFKLSDLPTAQKYARERIEDAIKIVIKPQS